MDHRILGAQLNSIVYLICVFLAGGWTGHIHSAWLAIAAMGVTYLSYIVQISAPTLTVQANCIVGLSVLLGAAAGIMLLV